MLSPWCVSTHASHALVSQGIVAVVLGIEQMPVTGSLRNYEVQGVMLHMEHDQAQRVHSAVGVTDLVDLNALRGE